MRSIGLLGLSLLVVGGRCASPPVEVSLRSSWPASPPLIEILETIALESPDAFFPLLDKITDPDILPSPEKLNPEAAHQAVLEIAAASGLLTEPGALASIELNLALHAATPKIEAFFNHYVDHHNATGGPDCGSWVEWYGEVVCDIEQLVKLAGVETIDPAKAPSTSPFPRPQLLTFDHIYPPPSRTLHRPHRTAIFYASPFSSNFRELHSYLLSLAKKPNAHVEYILRYVSPERDTTIRNHLSGYGVSLTLKKTDYLVLDDRNTRNGDKAVKQDDAVVTVDPILPLIFNHPENATAPSATTPLTEDEHYNLGPQVIQLIAESSDPLFTLKQLSQNFPKYATAIARRVVVNESIAGEIHINGVKIQGGGHMMWLNGASVADKDVNPFGLLRLLKKERAAISSLTSLGLQRNETLELLTHPMIAAAQSPGGSALDGIFDATDRTEGGDVIIYWNDIEKDSRYKNWSNSVMMLIRPSFAGIPTVRYNVFNVIVVMDLSRMESIVFVAGTMANMINRNLPLRFGLVPMTESEDGTKMAHLFYYLVSNFGRKKTLQFLQDFAGTQRIQNDFVDWDTLRSAFLRFSAVESETREVADLDDILAGKAANPAPLDKIAAYSQRLDTTSASSPAGHAFFNGKYIKYSDDDFLNNMQNELTKQMQHFQERVYTGKLTDAHNDTLGTYFYDQPTTSIRRNQYIFPKDTPGSLRVYNLPTLFSRIGFRAAPATFVYPAESAVIPLSLYVVADLDSSEGLNLVKEALLSIGSDTRTRISFLHNPVIDPSEESKRPLTSWLLSHLIKSRLLSKASPKQLLMALGVNAPNEDAQTVLSQDEAVRVLTEGVKVADFSAGAYIEFVEASRLLAREIGVKPGQQALLINGRVVGPFEGPNAFQVADFITLEGYEARKRAEPVISALEAISPSVIQADRATYADLISMASSAVAAIQLPDPSDISLFQAPQRPRNKQYQLLDSQYTAFEAGDNSTALFHIAVIMDPLSVISQKWSSLLEWLGNVPDTFIEIHLVPGHYSEMPLKNFYRYNLLSSLSFQENGREITPQAVFEDLPVEPIYTLAMDVPPAWLVRPREALYDLDNIQLSHLSPGDSSLKAIFDLDYLVVEGHAREIHNNSPPRGLQLELLRGGDAASPIDDTQVVANLGYFQFKATPGVFGLEIRKGRGRDVYEMESVGNEGWYSPTIRERGNEITLTNFEGLTLYPRFSRKPDMEDADVLARPEPDHKNSILESLTSRVTSLFKPKDVVPQGEKQADINIFTVASGLLYERFASIMILSVLRNTESTVKFWFIENFLSPSFLEFIPHFAEKYKFKYELVTYKWPSWLREQTEKQRIIWAYKILFLDVLFPMDLKKVIFVDADQIVRADLKELVDLDLHGAPYGYTPMGDDNTDMEGFRFWKTGYWKDFLRGLPYHISALYVIDLDRFRQMAAGDILRGHYQQLSADPNSLANLDQDLPNNLQREVPIFSLPEDWLWCETWCSKDRLHRAKTIDLCQNPLTKEPKLSRARQIPEWEVYDQEIAHFARQLADRGLIHSGLATADTNVLANEPAAAAPAMENSESTIDEENLTVEAGNPERDEL